MLRKLIFFAISSGLAKKAWDVYKARHAHAPGAPAAAPPDFVHTQPGVRRDSGPAR